MHKRPPTRATWLALCATLLVALLGPMAAAQGADAPTAAAQASDPVPEAADEAVRAWLQRQPVSVERLAALDPVSLCRMLPDLVTNPAPPPGTQVRIEDRTERPTDEPDERRFTYAAVRPGNQLDVVEVVMVRDGGTWREGRVGFLQQYQPTGVRAWLQTPAAAWVFVAFTLLVVAALLRRGSILRRWLAAGRAVIAEHRRLVVWTVVALYALFGLGAYVGSTLPQECEQAVLDVLNAAIGSVGAAEAYGSGNVVRAAATTYFQNFVVVTTSVIFPLAALFGVPAYLFAGLSFFTQGIPFGLLASGGPAYVAMLLVLLVLELTSYFLVVAGGGMLLATLLGRGGRTPAGGRMPGPRGPGKPAPSQAAPPAAGGPERPAASTQQRGPWQGASSQGAQGAQGAPPQGAFVRGLRKLLLMLPLAGLLLLIGAWYEALVIILGLA